MIILKKIVKSIVKWIKNRYNEALINTTYDIL